MCSWRARRSMAAYRLGEDAELERRTLRLVFSIACERTFPTRRCGRRLLPALQPPQGGVAMRALPAGCRPATPPRSHPQWSLEGLTFSSASGWSVEMPLATATGTRCRRRVLMATLSGPRQAALPMPRESALRCKPW